MNGVVTVVCFGTKSESTGFKASYDKSKDQAPPHVGQWSNHQAHGVSQVLIASVLPRIESAKYAKARQLQTTSAIQAIRKGCLNALHLGAAEIVSGRQEHLKREVPFDLLGAQPKIRDPCI